MKSVRTLCVIAHPDDETVLAGTVALQAERGSVYIICATSGDKGEYHGKKQTFLPFVREDELRRSGEILGVKHVSFLGVADGTICNNSYHEIARRLQQSIRKIRPHILITFEPRGITGHLDHIALSSIVTYVFEHQTYASELWYACMGDKQRAIAQTLPEYFVYFPPGYTKEEIDSVVDVSGVWEKKCSAIRAHKSQQKDVESFILPVMEQSPKEEYFLVRTNR